MNAVEQPIPLRESIAHEFESMAVACRSKGNTLRASLCDSIAEAYRAAGPEFTDDDLRKGVEEARAWLDVFAEDVGEERPKT